MFIFIVEAIAVIVVIIVIRGACCRSTSFDTFGLCYWRSQRRDTCIVAAAATIAMRATFTAVMLLVTMFGLLFRLLLLLLSSRGVMHGIIIITGITGDCCG